MENVIDLVQRKFIGEFQEMQSEVESYGYMNYTMIMNSKDYGVAQSRNRVFMLSIPKNHNYTEPKPFKLIKRLKDYLEDDVDEKYYLSDEQMDKINAWKSQQNPIDNAKFLDDEYMQTLTAKGNTSTNASMLLIKEATKKGYAEARYGDGVYINRPHQKRGVVQNGMIQTLKTSGMDVGVVVKDIPICLNSKVNGKQPSLQDRIYSDKGTMPAITTGFHPSVENNLRVRKLTTLECWRLMGVDDIYHDRANLVSSNVQLYKQAGNAIVVDVFAEIVRGMM